MENEGNSKSEAALDEVEIMEIHDTKKQVREPI